MKKRIMMVALAAVIGAMLTACSGGSGTQSSAASAAEQEIYKEAQSRTEEDVLKTETSAAESTAGQIPLTLTIGDAVLHAYLYDTDPARSLAVQLPITVSLNDSDNDFCGDSIEIEYREEDVTSGYQNGELAFWTPANNFVIFVSGEESSSGTGNLVPLGMITESMEMLETLAGSVDITITLAELPEDIRDNSTDNTSLNSADTMKQEVSQMRVNITVGNTTLTATLEDNETTRAFISQMPVTLPMSDLYGREMCYRYGAGGLPTDELRSDGYQIGDIAYWPPRGSLVILYGQNGEQFERQHLGHIDSGVEVFETTGDTEVTFELVES